MTNDILPDARVVKAVGQFVPVKGDLPSFRKIVGEAIPGTPAFVFINADRKVVGHIFGPLDPRLFVDQANDIRRLSGSSVKLSKADKPIALAMRVDAAGAQAALEILAKDKKIGKDTLAKAALAVGQAWVVKNDMTKAMAAYELAVKAAEDPFLVSFGRSYVASIYMMQGKIDASYKEFEAVSKMMNGPWIDRWCALYQMNILKPGLPKKG